MKVVPTHAIPTGLLTGVLYGGCATESVNGMGHELMLWTNGIGVLVIGWQEWPDEGALQALPFGGESRQAGVVQVSAMDETVAERTRVVHLYDGRRVVTVATYDLTTLSVEQAEEVAWAVYDALPQAPRPTTPGVVQRTFPELVAAIPSDTVSVSGIEDAPVLSPFTAALAIPVVTRQFIEGIF